MGTSPHGPADDGRFRLLFEHSSDAHLIFDAGGVTDCNPAAVRLLGAPDRAAVLAVHPAALSPEFQPDGRRSDQKAREMDALARANGWHRPEWVHRRLDGTPVPVAVTLSPVSIAGRPAMIVVWHDLTAIKRAEAELRPGDRLWVYSDGLPEAMAPGGEAFGENRLTAAFRAASGVPLADAVRGIISGVEGWVGPGGPQDDASVVALEFEGTRIGGDHDGTGD